MYTWFQEVYRERPKREGLMSCRLPDELHSLGRGVDLRMTNHLVAQVSAHRSGSPRAWEAGRTTSLAPFDYGLHGHGGVRGKAGQHIGLEVHSKDLHFWSRVAAR